MLISIYGSLSLSLPLSLSLSLSFYLISSPMHIDNLYNRYPILMDLHRKWVVYIFSGKDFKKKKLP
jgi:hypothetical protein